MPSARAHWFVAATAASFSMKLWTLTPCSLYHQLHQINVFHFCLHFPPHLNLCLFFKIFSLSSSHYSWSLLLYCIQFCKKIFCFLILTGYIFILFICMFLIVSWNPKFSSTLFNLSSSYCFNCSVIELSFHISFLYDYQG